MKNKPTAFAIIQTLKAKDCGLTARRIAELSNIDTSSENLRRIEEECWDFVEAGVCIFTDLRKAEKNAGLFFSVAN